MRFFHESIINLDRLLESNQPVKQCSEALGCTVAKSKSLDGRPFASCTFLQTASCCL